MSAQRLLVGLALMAAVLIGWKLLHPVYIYRFKLTVDVRQGGVTRSGWSVIELRTRRNPFLSKLAEVPEWETSVRGESVFVDLGKGEHIIALLVGRNQPGPTAALPSRAILGDKIAGNGSPGVLDTLSTLQPDALERARGKSYKLNASQMPPLVRFANLDDPASVGRVEPGDFNGKGQADLESVDASIEITGEPVTESISKRLPWLGRLHSNQSLSGARGALWKAGEAPFSNARQITYRNFKAERWS